MDKFPRGAHVIGKIGVLVAGEDFGLTTVQRQRAEIIGIQVINPQPNVFGLDFVLEKHAVKSLHKLLCVKVLRQCEMTVGGRYGKNPIEPEHAETAVGLANQIPPLTIDFHKIRLHGIDLALRPHKSLIINIDDDVFAHCSKNFGQKFRTASDVLGEDSAAEVAMVVNEASRGVEAHEPIGKGVLGEVVGDMVAVIVVNVADDIDFQDVAYCIKMVEKSAARYRRVVGGVALYP